MRWQQLSAAQANVVTVADMEDYAARKATLEDRLDDLTKELAAMADNTITVKGQLQPFTGGADRRDKGGFIGPVGKLVFPECHGVAAEIGIRDDSGSLQVADDITGYFCRDSLYRSGCRIFKGPSPVFTDFHTLQMEFQALY